MNYFKLIILISVLCFASISAFNIVHSESNSEQNDDPKDSVKSNPIQLLIDDYCKAKSIKNLTEKEISRLEGKIQSNGIYISKGKSEQEKCKKKKEEILAKPKTDSTLMANDSLKEIFVKSGNLEIEKSDSLIKVIEATISEIKKDNSEMTNIIDSLKNEGVKQKLNFDSKQKKLKTFASIIQGPISFSFCDVRYIAYIANLDSEEIKMHLFRKNKENFSNLGAVREFLEHEKMDPRMITNAGMFTPTNEPEGLYIEENSKIFYELDTTKRNTDENFFLYPNGVFFIDSNNVAHVETTNEFVKIQKDGKSKPKLATQSGPMLVIDGKLHDKFTAGSRNEKIRSGVGIMNGKKVIFAITLTESNFYEFASFFKDVFSCKDALFLDGAISQMYLKDINQNSGGHFGPLISVSKKH